MIAPAALPDLGAYRRFVVAFNDRCTYRRGSKLRRAWQRGYDAASRSAEPASLML